MENESVDGARRARLVRERVRAGHGAMRRPLYIGVRIHMYIYIYTEREKTGERNGERERFRRT